MQNALDSKQEVATGNGVQSIERALDLLECLAHTSDWMGISELSIATGQPVGTVHRLLMTLMAREYVTRDSRTRRYALGPAFRTLASIALQTPNWSELASPYLRELVEISGETANLTVLERDRAVYVAQAQPSRVVRMFTELGNRVPLYNTACGKVLLAHQPERVLNTFLDEAVMVAYTSRTITDPGCLREHLIAVRQQGYAIDNGEQEEGVHCISVPVIGSGEKIVAAISISGPSSRIDETHTASLVPHMKRVSGELTASLVQTHQQSHRE